MIRSTELSKNTCILRAITLAAAVTVLIAPTASFAQGRNPGKHDDAPKREETKREEPRRAETPAPRREESRYNNPVQRRDDSARMQEPRRQDNWQPARRNDNPGYQPRQYQNRPSDTQPAVRQNTWQNRPGSGDVRPQHDTFVPREPRTGDNQTHNRPDPAPQNPVLRRDPQTDGRGFGGGYGYRNPVVRPGDGQYLPDTARFGRQGVEQAPRTVPGARPPFTQPSAPQQPAPQSPLRNDGSIRQRDHGSRPERDYGSGREHESRPVRDHSDYRERRISPERVHSQVLFTQSREGRNYRNGVVLRGGGYVPPREVQVYYRDYCYYPYYYPRYEPTVVYYSPYSYYTGVCAPYIYREHCVRTAPPTVWVDLSFGVDDSGAAGSDPSDNYYLARGRDSFDLADVDDSELRDAVASIRDAFLNGNIEPMVDLIDPATRIAVFHKEKYDYSVPSNDYLGMTRDALRNMETVDFRILRVTRKEDDVYSVSAVHVYRDHDGEQKAVGLSFVFERIHDRWMLTQVGSAPAR